MLLRIFKGYQAFLLILVPAGGIFLWLNAFMNHQVEYSGQYTFMPLSQIVFNIVGIHTWLSKCLAYVLVLFNAILLVRLNIAYNFIKARTYLPGVIYIIIMSFIPDLQRLTPALMSGIFIIFAISKLMSTFKKDKLAIQIMDASLLISVASLFYFPVLYLIILLWIGLILIRPFRWREWVFTIIGMTTPYLLVAGIKYIMGTDAGIPFSALFNVAFVLPVNIVDVPFNLAFFSYLFLLVLLASLQVMRLFATKKVHSRRFYILFLWLFMFTAGFYFIIPSASTEILYIMAIPVSFLLTHYFIHLRKELLAEVFFMILLAMVILNKVLVF